MPPIYRTQLFFADGYVGWSETYWSNAASSIDNLLTRSIALAQKRMLILGQGVLSPLPTTGPLITYIRCEDLTSKAIKIANGQDVIGQGFKQRSLGASEVPWSTILLRYTFGDGTSFYRSMRELSGAPDDVIIDPPGPNQGGDWFKNFQQWKAYLTNANNGWCFPHFVYTAIPGLNVVAVNWASGGLLTLTFNNPPAASSPTTFWARSFTPRQWNGSMTMTAALVPPGNVWTTTNKFFKQPVGPIAPGFLATRSYTLFPITDVQIRGETHRARGRVFGQPRGRRPVKVK